MTEPTPRPKDMTPEQLDALPAATAFEKIPFTDTNGLTRYKRRALRGLVHQCRPDDIAFWTDADGDTWTPALIEVDGEAVWAKRYFGL